MTAYEMRIGDWSSDVCASDLVPAAGEAVEHVADVADQRAGQRRRGDPALRRLHLPAAVRVLGQQRAQAVVAVLADAPVLLTIARRRRGGYGEGDRKSVGEGQSVSVRRELGGCRSNDNK